MNRIDKLQARRLDPRVSNAKLLNEVYRSMQQSDGVRYAIGAMQPIDSDYTANTFEQGLRIQKSIADDQYVQSCEFKFQGSTTNNTHIKAASDIDLVVLTQKFTWLKAPLQPPRPYTGDTKVEMKSLRDQCIDNIRSNFPAVVIDDSGGKAVKLSGGSLTRNVDLVPAGWLDTQESQALGDDYRGIEIIDRNSGENCSNFPWIHNLRVEEKDSRCLGGLRRAARLMKSLKADSDQKVMLSSYDIASIAYNIPDAHLSFQPPLELSILDSCRNYCVSLKRDQLARDTISVPNGTRTVFCAVGASVEQLDNMIRELEQLITDIARDVQRPFIRLAEARIEHPFVPARPLGPTLLAR